MLIYYDINAQACPLTCYDDLHIKHKLDGEDEMSFSIPTNADVYKQVIEETQIDYGDNEWLVKKIDDDKFDCRINFDFLKTRAYQNLRIETKPLAWVLEQYLPSGWTVHNANVSSISRTTELECCTDYDVIYSCMKTYSVYFVWKTLTKDLYVFSQDSDGLPNNGEYITRDLNLKTLSFKGESTDFATRIYAYGKDGLTMEYAMVNGSRYNKQYIDNNTYASKRVVYVWKDERYTSPETLYSAAKEKLKKMAAPVRSYECTVNDLAKQQPSFAFLQFKMHYKAILLDPERKTREEHKVVQYDEYPDNPSKNVVTLSATSGTIQQRIKSKTSELNEIFEEKSNAFNEKVAAATAFLLSAYGTYKFEDGNGNTYLADNANLDLAQSVWLFNVNGMGHSSTGKNGPYTTSITANDELTTSIINAMVIRGQYIEANSITAAKINQSYTDDVISQAVTIADGHITAEMTNLETGLQTYIDTEAGNLTTAFQTADATLQSAITANQNGLSAEITDRTNAVSALQASITATAGQISSVMSRVENVENTTKNILIDSACFATRTQRGYYATITSSNIADESEPPSGTAQSFTFTATTASHNKHGIVFRNDTAKPPIISLDKIKPQTTYTLTFYAKLSYGTNYFAQAFVDSSPSSSVLSDTPPNIGTSWKKFTTIFHTGAGEISHFYLCFYLTMDAGQTATLYLSSLQLEEGEASTYWVENQKDILDKEYATKEELTTSITQTADAIALKADATIVEQLQNTVSKNSATIETKATQILSTVSSTYQTKTAANTMETTLRSYIDQKANDLRLAVESDIDDVAASIDLCVQADENGNVTSDIALNSNNLTITSDNFKLTKTGNITASSGTIGGWNISPNALYTSFLNGDTKYTLYLHSPEGDGKTGATTDLGSKIIAIRQTSNSSNYIFAVSKEGNIDANGGYRSHEGFTLSTDSDWSSASVRGFANPNDYKVTIGNTAYQMSLSTSKGIYCGGVIRAENVFINNGSGALVSLRSLI